MSLYSLILRTVRLARRSSTCRPLGSPSAWALDYFDWNFLLSFPVLSVVIAVGLSRDPVSVRMASLPLSLLLLLVCGQLVVFIPLRALGVRAPIRFSSVARGEPLRPAVYTIAEDVVAVDGGRGDVFRAQWSARYESSAPFRTLLARLDWVFGVSGVVVAGAIIGVIFGVEEDSVGWAIGEFAPELPTYIFPITKNQNPRNNIRLNQLPSRLVRPLDLGRGDDAHHDRDDESDMQAGKQLSVASRRLKGLGFTIRLHARNGSIDTIEGGTTVEQQRIPILTICIY